MDRYENGTRWYGIRPWSTHSLVLALSGLAYICIGIATHFIVPYGPRWEALVVARHWMPLDFWAGLFVLVGAATILSARWPPTADKWGYMVLSGFSAGWGAFYAMGVIFENTPVSNLSGTALYWLIAFMWWAISRLLDPETVSRVVDRVLKEVREDVWD